MCRRLRKSEPWTAPVKSNIRLEIKVCPGLQRFRSMTPSDFVLPSGWRVILIHLQMWPSPFQSLLTALRGSLWTSTALSLFSQIMCTQASLVFSIFWTGWLIPCFDCFVHQVHSVTTWTLWPVFAWDLTVSLILDKTKKLWSRETSWGFNMLFSVFANMLQHVTINDPKPDLWPLGVQAGKDLTAGITVGPNPWPGN